MAFAKSKIINVLNYNENPVVIKTHVRGYLIEKSEGESPTLLPLEFSEIQYLNSNSNVFTTGTLLFQEDEQEDIYDELRITDWKDILRNADIEKIVLKPTAEGLTKLINIKDVSTFERVRGVFYSLKNTGRYDLSTRVEMIITARYKELCQRKINTAIELTSRDTSSPVLNKEVEDLKTQNQSLQEQMIKMQEKITQMMSMQSSSGSNNETEKTSDENVEVSKSKSPGRPKKPTK